MKILISLLLISSQLLAAKLFIPNDRAREITKQINNICADTFCGGDLQFYASSMVCKNNECKMEFSAKGVSLFHDPKDIGIFYRTRQSFENEDVFVTYRNYSLRDHADFRYNELKINFTCEFTNLKENRKSFYNNYEMIYSMTLDCIAEFENTIYDY